MSDLEGQQLTAAQREALEAELADMEGPQRKAAVDAIATARAFGDLSENFEYHAAKNEQGLLEARIRKLRHRLHHAVTVEHTSTEHGRRRLDRRDRGRAAARRWKSRSRASAASRPTRRSAAR